MSNLRITTVVCAGSLLLAGIWPATPTAAPATRRLVVDQAQGIQGRGNGVIFEPPRPAPPPTTGSGTISGVVLDSTTRRPIAGALVAGFIPISGVAPPPRVVTDDQGRFVITDLPAGTIRVSTTHPEFVIGTDPDTGTFSSTQITLNEQQWIPDVTLHLHRPSAIGGTVYDEHGDPVVGVPVRVLRLITIGTSTYPVRALSGETDDRGMYRAGGLPPGEYIVQVPGVQMTVRNGSLRPPVGTQRPLALSSSGESFSTVIGHFPTSAVAGRVYPMAYHPSAQARTDAAQVTLGRNDTRSGVDVRLSLVPTYTVSGILTGAGAAAANMPVWLTHVGDESAGPGSEVAMTLSGANGDFTLLNVPVGTYTLTASRLQGTFTQGGRGATGGFSEVFPERGYAFDRSMGGQSVAAAPGVSFFPRGKTGEPGFGRAVVTVTDKDVTAVAVPLTSGVTVSGHFVWDGQPTAPGRGAVPGVWLDPADGTPALGAPQSGFHLANEGEPMPFEITGVMPGRYFVTANESSGLSILRNLTGNYVTRIEWRGRNLTATPLEVTADADISGIVIHVSTTPSVVAGTVRDSRSATPAAAVLVFPATPSDWDDVGFGATRFGLASVNGGTFRSPHLPPGDYLVAAVPVEEQGRRFDRRFLATLAPQATKVRVEPAAATTVALTLIGGGR
jgi:hypothetical protein